MRTRRGAGVFTYTDENPPNRTDPVAPTVRSQAAHTKTSTSTFGLIGAPIPDHPHLTQTSRHRQKNTSPRELKPQVKGTFPCPKPT